MAVADHKQSIYELACRYARAVDRRDWPALEALFAPGASIRGPGFSMDGHEAILAGMGALGQYSATQHHVHNQLVAFDGPAACAETYCVASHIYERDGAKRKLDWGVRYQDRVVFDGNEWRFAQRELVVDWTQDLPLQG